MLQGSWNEAWSTTVATFSPINPHEIPRIAYFLNGKHGTAFQLVQAPCFLSVFSRLECLSLISTVDVSTPTMQ